MVEISVNDNIMVGESDFGLVNVKNLVNFSMEKLYEYEFCCVLQSH